VSQRSGHRVVVVGLLAEVLAGQHRRRSVGAPFRIAISNDSWNTFMALVS